MDVITDNDWELRLYKIFRIFENPHLVILRSITVSCLESIFGCGKYSRQELWQWLGGALSRSGNVSFFVRTFMY